MQAEFTIPGTLGPRIEVRRTLLGTTRVSADGERLERRGWFRGRYEVRTTDGVTHEFRLAGGLTALKVRVDDTEIQLERSLEVWEVGLVFLPMLLVLIGGAVGGIFGAVAAGINGRVARSQLRAPSRVVAMLAVSLLSAGVWFGTVVRIGVALAPIPEFAVGSCLLGLESAEEITNETVITVDCDTLHDGEVIAHIEHPDGPYPGQEPLLDYGLDACEPLFEAYVGSPYAESRLLMFTIGLSEILWLKGDRTIDCIVYTPSNSRQTESVRDSG